MRREDGSRPSEEPPAANAVRRLRFRAFLLRNARAGRTQKRARGPWDCGLKLSNQKERRTHALLRRSPCLQCTRIPPAIRFELPERCNKRSERNTSDISVQTLETPLLEASRMTLSEKRPAGFLHLVASAPPRSKKRPAGNACRPEAFQPKGAEVLRARRTSFSMSRTLGHGASRAVSTSPWT